MKTNEMQYLYYYIFARVVVRLFFSSKLYYTHTHAHKYVSNKFDFYRPLRDDSYGTTCVRGEVRVWYILPKPWDIVVAFM